MPGGRETRNLLMKDGPVMGMHRIVVTGVALAGITASVAAGALFWLILTQPVAAAALVGGGF